MLGLSIDKIVVLLVVAVFVVGPERMPKYAAQLARLVRSLRSMAEGAKDRLRDEMGPDFDDVDWKKLDPRQYDPRRIIRSALLDDSPGEAASMPVVGLVKPAISREDSAEGLVDKSLVTSETGETPAHPEPEPHPDSRPEPDFEPQVDALANAFRLAGN
jgi:sec-independent protein translocase protein TatB